MNIIKFIVDMKIKEIVATKKRVDKLNIVHANQLTHELDYLKKLQKNALKNIAQSISDRRVFIKQHFTIVIKIRNDIKQMLKIKFFNTEKRIFNHRSDWEMSATTMQWKKIRSALLKTENQFSNIDISDYLASKSLQTHSSWIVDLVISTRHSKVQQFFLSTWNTNSLLRQKEKFDSHTRKTLSSHQENRRKRFSKKASSSHKRRKKKWEEEQSVREDLFEIIENYWSFENWKKIDSFEMKKFSFCLFCIMKGFNYLNLFNLVE